MGTYLEIIAAGKAVSLLLCMGAEVVGVLVFPVTGVVSWLMLC